MSIQTIPADLLKRYPELIKGLADLQHARNEARFNGLIRSNCPEPITKVLPQLGHAAVITAEAPQPEPTPPDLPVVKPAVIPSTYEPKPTETKPQPQPITPGLPQAKPAAVLSTYTDKAIEPTGKPQELRIYPLVMLCAIRTKQDIAARLWFIAKHCDPAGNGWVYKSKLWDFLRSNNVGERQRRRWMTAALAAGLLIEDTEKVYGNKPIYRILGVYAGAEILGAEERGRPVLIPVNLMLKRSWHPYAWAGYLATRNGAPISQATLAEITGLSARVQKKYQKIAPVNKTRNYVKTNLKRTHLRGLRENGRPSAFVGYKGMIYFRLPDSVKVPESMARRPPKADKSKVKNDWEKSSRFSFIVGREKSDLFKLFHPTKEKAESVINKIKRLESVNRPREVFYKTVDRGEYQVWAMLPVESVAGVC